MAAGMPSCANLPWRGPRIQVIESAVSPPDVKTALVVDGESARARIYQPNVLDSPLIIVGQLSLNFDMAFVHRNDLDHEIRRIGRVLAFRRYVASKYHDIRHVVPGW